MSLTLRLTAKQIGQLAVVPVDASCPTVGPGGRVPIYPNKRKQAHRRI